MAHTTITVLESGGLCENCGSPTSLIKPEFWKLDSEECSDDDGVREIEDELTIHYCEICDRITSISLNFSQFERDRCGSQGAKRRE